MGPDALYLLVHHPPDVPTATGERPGWVLVAFQGSVQRWSIRLVAHGADADAGSRVAKAVAVRLLADRGVRVQGWHAGQAEQPPIFRARLGHTADRPHPLSQHLEE